MQVMNIHNILTESIYNQLILEAKSPEQVLQILVNKYAEDGFYTEDRIKAVMNIDPTKKYSYTQWALKAMDSDDEEDYYNPDSSETIKVLKRLFKFAQEHNDFQLQTFPTVTAAFAALEEYLGKDAYHVVYEDDGWIIYVPDTYEAERYIVWHLYNGATWCTAANSDNGRYYFDRYNEGTFKLYVNANKNTNEIYQYSPKSGEFNDSENDAVEDFDDIGITQGALEFYKSIGFDIEESQKEARFEEDAEELDSTGVYLMDNQLWLSYNEQLSDGSTDYSDYTSDFYISDYCIAAPHYRGSYTFDIYVNQDKMTGEHKGWHLEYDNFEVEDYGSWELYGQWRNYFGYLEYDEGWFNCIDGVKYAEKMISSDPEGIWFIDKEDGSKVLFSRELGEYDFEYTSKDIEHDGLYGFAKMIDEYINSGWVNEFDDNYIVIEADSFQYFKQMLQALNYTNVKAKPYPDDNEYVMIYYSDYDGGDDGEEETNWEEYAKEIGTELGVQWGVDNGDEPYILVPRTMPREELNTIHYYLRNHFGSYKMLPSEDENIYKISIKPVNQYSMAEGIKEKFNTILEKISKNYNPERLVD